MDCIFCKIVARELPSNIVYEDEHVLGFHDIQPQAPVHLLFIPKKHIASMNDMGESDWPLLAELHKAAVRTAQQLGLSESGYRLINNCGKDAGQVVFHLHYHLLGGANLGPLVASGGR